MQHIEQHFSGSDSVRDVVIGMADDLTVPFALGNDVAPAGAVAEEVQPQSSSGAEPN